MVGTALTKLLLAGGHRVTGLTRKPSEADPGRTARVRWEPESGTLHTGDVDGHDVAVHLAGENIAAGPWTATRKARIRDSRVRGTDLLCRTLAAAENGPRVLVCASAVGFYGDRGDTSVDESSRPGEGFLAQTCVEWEAAAAPARAAEIRVVHLRIGMVLSPAGGALSRMLPQWRLGLGGPLGGGRQFWSWISLDDLVSVILHAAIVEGLEGPVNAVAPRAVRNAEFSRTLGKVLDRPAVLPAPSLALRLLLGEMADEMLLGGANVVPRRLQETGFEWRHPELEGALRHVLGRPRETAG
jgi:uncharacterized protein (TIGR01777 family)